MDNNKLKFLLGVQAGLIAIGLVIQVTLLIFIASNNLSTYMLVSSIFLVLTHIAVAIYGIFGYKLGKIPYIISIVLFLIAILVNILLPFRDIPQKILLVILFGLISVFLFKQDDYKFTNIIILIASIVSLGFSIYSSITADYSSLGEITYKDLATILMYLSIFTPVVLTGLFGVTYNYEHSSKNN